MNYEEIMERGIRRTIISFDPFLKREDVRGLTDAQVGKKFGLATKTVKAMRLHQDVPQKEKARTHGKRPGFGEQVSVWYVNRSRCVSVPAAHCSVCG